jgi:hypothetical protein
MINIYTNMNKTNNPLSPQRIEHKKESLNIDGQHLHKYQQNKQPPLTSTHWT